MKFRLHMDALESEQLRGRHRIREVTQTILASPDNEPGVLGNCFQAAVAALLDMPLDAVPHFVTFGDRWYSALLLWCETRGLHVFAADINDQDVIGLNDPCLVTGMSPRGVQHVVVVAERAIAWDSHPSRDGLETLTGAIWLRP